MVHAHSKCLQRSQYPCTQPNAYRCIKVDPKVLYHFHSHKLDLLDPSKILSIGSPWFRMQILNHFHTHYSRVKIFFRRNKVFRNQQKLSRNSKSYLNKYYLVITHQTLLPFLLAEFVCANFSSLTMKKHIQRE